MFGDFYNNECHTQLYNPRCTRMVGTVRRNAVHLQNDLTFHQLVGLHVLRSPPKITIRLSPANRAQVKTHSRVRIQHEASFQKKASQVARSYNRTHKRMMVSYLQHRHRCLQGRKHRYLQSDWRGNVHAFEREPAIVVYFWLTL